MAKSPRKPRRKAQALTVSAPVAARVFGISRRQFDRLASQGVLKRAEARTFDLLEIGPAFMRYVRDGREQTSEAAEARLKYLDAQRRAVEQRTRERAGELVERHEVKAVFANCLVMLRAHLESVPGRCAAEFISMTDKSLLYARLMEEMRRVLSTAAGELEHFEHGAGVGGAAAAATRANGGGMG